MSKPLAAKSIGACSRACSHPPASGRAASSRERNGYEGHFEVERYEAPARRNQAAAMLLNREDGGESSRPRLSEGSPFPPEFDLPSTVAKTWSLASLYQDHSAKLRAFFKARSSALNAEDLVQETFVRLAKTPLSRPGTIEQPHAYVSQVARNLLREQARFAARRSAALHMSHDDIDLAGPDPVAQLEARDMLERLEAAMAKMKPATREIFMAHRIKGCTYREIEASTGRSTKSIEKHMAKAIFLVNRSMRRG